jgi:hypothetical protein
VGKYTSLARTLRHEPEETTFGKNKGSSGKNTYVNINNIYKDIDSNPPPEPSETITTLRPTTLTTLIKSEKDEKLSVVCIHSMDPQACALCSGYVRWLIEDEGRISAAKSNPEATRRRYRETLEGSEE